MRIIRQIISFLKNWFWTKPVEKPEPFKATEVKHLYTCIDYKGQWVNIKKTEVDMFNAMARTDKRAMARRFAVLQKKGHVRFEEIGGQMMCIKNKDYESKADTRK
jgi:hypothetical protein